MPSNDARPAGLPPVWGRDALRRVAVFSVLFFGTLAIGTVVVMRTLAPPADEISVSARIELPADADPIEPEGLRYALARPEHIEAVLQSQRLARPGDRPVLASAIAARLNVSSSRREGAPGCRITLSSMPGLPPRQAAKLLDGLTRLYVDQLHDARVDNAERKHRQAEAAVEAARQRLNHSRLDVDEAVRRLSAAAAAAANAPAVVVEAPVDKAAVSAQRAEAEHQLSELRARRESLLERRTPAHPDVIDLDERIAAITARLGVPAALPSSVYQAPAVANVPAAMDRAAQENLMLAQGAFQRAEAGLAAAQQAEREAHDALVQARADRRETLTAAVVPATTAPQPLAPWLLAVLAAGLVLAGGATLCVRPSTIHTAAEVQRVLRMPVVGVLPANLVRSYERAEPAA